ncbi:ASCH domain-containing protein [Delftia sp. 60]|uniref:ASCH domain-containing protein n=1 Tax=Delftia sp. 60 TaxID=2035216 RepID=UPI000C1A56AD|nr:ASCH domain-containing protein [Delftia sp. 60]PIF38645.1 ASCH domain-containing protein [Burkholderiales bacterium 23]PIF66176.1 ASCH domain-containing protein [Delftia sp. 60]
MIPALTIRQPWAWLIVHGHKDIENRECSTPFRSQLLVHSGLTMTRAYYDEITKELGNASMLPAGGLLSYDDLPRGGLVGWTSIVDGVAHSASKLKQVGSFGFVLLDRRPMPFVPWRCRLQFFNLPELAAEAHSHDTR